MEFEEYLKSKKIDPASFKKAEIDQYEDFDRLFSQMHPESFTAQKLFLINDIRRRFTLKEDTSITKAPAAARPKPVIKPKPTDGETTSAKPKVPGAKPVMKPKVPGAKPVVKPKVPGTSTSETEKVPAKKPVMKPRVPGAKPIIKAPASARENADQEKPAAKKPVIKPKIPVKPKASETPTADASKPVMKRPVIKPKIKPVNIETQNEENKEVSQLAAKKKPQMRPKITPRKKD